MGEGVGVGVGPSRKQRVNKNQRDKSYLSDKESIVRYPKKRSVIQKM